jgi:hypothetical protein
MDVWVARLQDELDGGYQIARFSPPRRRHLGYLDYYALEIAASAGHTGLSRYVAESTL